MRGCQFYTERRHHISTICDGNYAKDRGSNGKSNVWYEKNMDKQDSKKLADMLGLKKTLKWNAQKKWSVIVWAYFKKKASMC